MTKPKNGKNTFKALADDSSVVEAKGIFHTVWKRDEMENGSTCTTN